MRPFLVFVFCQRDTLPLCSSCFVLYRLIYKLLNVLCLLSGNHIVEELGEQKLKRKQKEFLKKYSYYFAPEHFCLILISSPPRKEISPFSFGDHRLFYRIKHTFCYLSAPGFSKNNHSFPREVLWYHSAIKPHPSRPQSRTMVLSPEWVHFKRICRLTVAAPTGLDFTPLTGLKIYEVFSENFGRIMKLRLAVFDNLTTDMKRSICQPGGNAH